MNPINRSLLKENAKAVLRRNFWMPVLVCFVASFLGGNWTGLQVGSSGGASFRIPSTSSRNYSNYSGDYNYSSDDSAKLLLEAVEKGIQESNKGSDFYYDYDDSLSESDNIKAFYNDCLDYFNITSEDVVGFLLMVFGIVLIVFAIIWLIMAVITFAIGSFVGAPVGVGYRKYFMNNREGTAKFDDLFSAFSGGHYMDVVKIMFKTNIRIWGWSLLFYFPGLVKFYQYYLVSYIAAENPTLTPERVRELSREMTNGHKWQIFVLELSFLGWAMLFVLIEVLLALISCGLLAIPGILLMYPLVAYRCATIAELYAERREYMIHAGFANAVELPGFVEQTVQTTVVNSAVDTSFTETPVAGIESHDTSVDDQNKWDGQ
ncbi:MAG: DUF975 family protein [Eubacteriales bacterium]|nr:DUF975 family protein [Eubacteriales bacterium]